MAARIVTAGIVTPGVMATGTASQHAAPGIFLYLEVVDFDFLSFLSCHLIFFRLLV